MIIDIVKLKSGIIDKIDIDETITFDVETLKKVGIIDLKNVEVKGYITRLGNSEYYIKAKVFGKMILPCSVTLKPTDYEFCTEFEGNIKEMLKEIKEFERILENTIDILPIIWENILMEIPIRVVNENISDATLEGEGWKFVTEEVSNINPEFEKLKDLLK